MGRGRAKAKQQKVARELKYNTHFTDLSALQRELGVSGSVAGPGVGPDRSDGHRSAADDDDTGADDVGGDTDDDAEGDPEHDYDSWTGTDR